MKALIFPGISLKATCRTIAFAASVFVLPSLGYAQTPVKGGTLTVMSVADISTLNPAIAAGAPVMMPGAQLFAGLVEFDRGWKPEPYLAQSWDVSRDGKQYTFHLVKGAVFHDGTPITSADVAFSIEAVRDNHPFGKQMFSSVASIETPDPLTVVVNLSKPSAAFLLALSPQFTPILPKHIYGVGNIRTNPHNLSPVGSGPFEFVAYKPGEYVELKRFDRFFRSGKPYINKIIFSILKGRNAQALAMSRGDVQYSPMPPMGLSDIVRLQKDPNLAVTDKGNEGIGWIVWLEYNERNALFKDVRVRQAISYAIDKNFIRQKLQLGMTRPATSAISPESPFFDPQLNPYNVDLARANTLLDEAGYKKNADGIRFAVRLDWQPTAPDFYQTVAEYLRPQLRKVGIDVQLRPAPDFSTWAERVSNGDYDMDISSSFNYGDPTIGVSRTFDSTNIRKGVAFSNVTGYSNPKVDALLNAAAVEQDMAKRKQDYFEFQKIVNDEVPLSILFEVPIYTIANKHVQNVPDGIWGGLVPYDNIYLSR